MDDNTEQVVESKIKDEPKIQLKNLFSYLPHLSILIIIYGLIKQLIYYTNFNVPIKYFLGLSELGLVVSEDLLIVIPFIVFLMIFVNIVYKEENIFNISMIKLDNKSKLVEKKEKKIKGYFIFSLVSGLFFLLLVIISLTLIFTETIYYKKLESYALLTMSLIAFLTPFTNHLLYKRSNIKIRQSILFTPITVLIFVTAFTAREIRSVENGKFNGTIIETKDSTYRSTNSSFFIGKTEKYVFIYNKKDSSTDIIPTESIKKMKLKSK